MYVSTRYNNICKENNSYRVRVSKNTKRYSKSYSNLRAAINFRNKIKQSI